MDADRLRQYLEFYRDLGVKTVYNRAGRAKDAAPAPKAAKPAKPPAPVEPVIAAEPMPTLIPPDPPPAAAPSESLLQILQDLGDCRRCRLHEGRQKIVFGSGNEKSPLVFVGEGPGADEDAQGLPFVGRAGQLLTQMIEGTAAREGIDIKRPDVYICNVVKCRPPDNRTPEADEMEICGQFLFRQLMSIKPKAICVLGGTAAKAITGHKEGVTKMRGKWFQWRDIPVMVTYHPSFLLRAYNQEAKREAWEDLKKVLHFVYD
jgi:DNA polymerase